MTKCRNIFCSWGCALSQSNPGSSALLPATLESTDITSAPAQSWITRGDHLSESRQLRFSGTDRDQICTRSLHIGRLHIHSLKLLKDDLTLINRQGSRRPDPTILSAPQMTFLCEKNYNFPKFMSNTISMSHFWGKADSLMFLLSHKRHSSFQTLHLCPTIWGSGRWSCTSTFLPPLPHDLEVDADSVRTSTILPPSTSRSICARLTLNVECVVIDICWPCECK